MSSARFLYVTLIELEKWFVDDNTIDGDTVKLLSPVNAVKMVMFLCDTGIREARDALLATKEGGDDDNVIGKCDAHRIHAAVAWISQQRVLNFSMEMEE